MASVDICNSALIKLGVETITSLSDNTRQALLCNSQYNVIRKKLLRQHPWNFAVKRATLTANGNTPDWDYTQEFDLPSDYLRLLDTKYPDDKYQIESNKILAFDETIYIRYIADITDTDEFSSDFTELLAMALAVDLSYVLVQSNALTQTLMASYDRMLKDVRSFDGQENPSQEITDDLFINSRY